MPKILLPDDTLIWIGTHGQGLAAFDRKRNHFIHYKNNTTFPFTMNDPAWLNHLYKDSKKRLWISTYSGLFLYDGKSLQHFEHTKDTTSISSNSVNMTIEDADHNIWVISESGGLDLLNENTNTFIRYNEKYNLPETMKAMVVDDKGVLWITSNQWHCIIESKTELHKTIR